jgi:Pyridoxamine 5'-phosphate oxidase
VLLPQAGAIGRSHAALARWMVHHADYGVTSTHSALRAGYPFGNVLSMSDGARGNSTGRVLFYVATISQFTADVADDARMSFTLTEAQETTPRCYGMDPEWPLCARVRALCLGCGWGALRRGRMMQRAGDWQLEAGEGEAHGSGRDRLVCRCSSCSN